MNKHQLQELEQRIDEVLFYVWDPIGVSDSPYARCEYSSYTKTLLNYVLQEDLKKIANQLEKIETVSIGLGSRRDKNLLVAELLIDYKSAVEEGIK